MHQQQTAFENIVGKEEIAPYEQFLLFPQCFLLNQIIVSQFVHIFSIISLFATELEEPRFGISGKGSMKKPFECILEKQKIVETSIFFLFGHVFYSIRHNL